MGTDEKESTRKLMDHKTVQKRPIINRLMFLLLWRIPQQPAWRSLVEGEFVVWKGLNKTREVNVCEMCFCRQVSVERRFAVLCKLVSFTCPGCSHGVCNSACWQVSLTFLYLGRLLVCWVLMESSFFLRIFLQDATCEQRERCIKKMTHSKGQKKVKLHLHWLKLCLCQPCALSSEWINSCVCMCRSI